MSYERVGDISAARGDRDGALKAFNDGLEIRKALAARDPNNAEWQRDLSVSYERVGDISAARGDRDGALKAFNDGLEIRKALAARDPNNAEWRDLGSLMNSVSYSTRNRTSTFPPRAATATARSRPSTMALRLQRRSPPAIPITPNGSGICR